MRTACIATLAAVVLAGPATAGTLAESDMTHSRYIQWSNGPSTDPGFFPICVWAQNPRHAGRYKAIGINTYIALHGGPTAEQLDILDKYGVKAICHQNRAGLAHPNKSTIIAWMHGDEPDNFKREDGKWAKAVPADKIIADYKRLKQRDRTRPILLNLGQGVANDHWKGGWAKEADYREFVKGCDIVSFDIYPACSTQAEVAGKLWLVPKGVDRLRQWSGDKKIVWNILECTRISHPTRKATPEEIKAEVWMSLIHGSRGIVYFCHEFLDAEGNRRVTSNALLQDEATRDAVGKINAQVAALAPVLNAPTVVDVTAAETSGTESRVDYILKKHNGDVYLFAVSTRPVGTRATFKVPNLVGEAQVLGEDRVVKIVNDTFTDEFGRYGVHLYKIGGN